MSKNQFTGNRNATANFINLIMTSTVHGMVAQNMKK